MIASRLRDAAGVDWQHLLFKSSRRPPALAGGGRDNAAANGRCLTMSLDGNWVQPLGGGGYRPGDKE